jgi:hypothetical protein
VSKSRQEIKREYNTAKESMTFEKLLASVGKKTVWDKQDE